MSTSTTEGVLSWRASTMTWWSSVGVRRKRRALRAAEKGYRVGVMESGRRWKDEDLPKSQWHLPDFLWFPDLTLPGTMRVATAGPVGSAAGLGGRARPRVGRAVIASI
jgi:hypothetical protein